MAVETVGVRAVVEKLDQYLAGVNQMNTRTDQLITTVERLAQSSVKTNALLEQTAQAYQRKATASNAAKKADEEHVGVLQKIENQLKRNLSASVQFSGAFLIIKAQQAVFEALGAAIVGMNARLEQANIAFRTMLGSARAAGEFLGELQQFAAATPFEFPDLVTATQRMLAFQISASKVIPLLTAIGDAAAALGSGKEGIDRITLALGQMSAKGKVSGEELRQLAEAGIPGLKILAQELKITTAEAQALVTEGAISADTFIAAFQKFSELNFGGLMKEQEKTFLGAISTIKDQLLLLGSDAFQPLFQSIRNITVAFSEFLKGSDAAGIAKTIADAFKVIAQNANFLLPIITALTVRFAALAVVGAITWAFRAIPALAALAEAFQLVTVGAASAGEAMQLLAVNSAKALGPVGLLILAFTALDLATKAITGRGLTERILGIGGAAGSASEEVKRLNDRVDQLTEAGVPRGEAKNIVAKDAAEQLDLYTKRLDAAKKANQEYVDTQRPANIAINELAKALSFTENPVRDAADGVAQFRQQVLDLTKTANDLRAAIADRPDLEAFFAPEIARRAANETKNLVAAQQEAARSGAGLAQRQADAFNQLDQFVSDAVANNREWAQSLQTAVAQTQGQVTPNLKKIEEAFSLVLDPSATRQDVQKFLEEGFGGQNNALARLFEKLSKDAEQGRKNVLGALKDLVPESDELFSEWLARLNTFSKNLGSFSNNLRFVFETLSKNGIQGAEDFTRVLETAGPNITAAVAGMIAIDPDSVTKQFAPIAKGIAGGMSGHLTDAIVANQATTQETIGSTLSSIIIGGIDRAQDPIFKRMRQLANDIMAQAGVAAASLEVELEQLTALHPELDKPIEAAKPQAAPPVQKPTPSESPGALSRLADEAEKAARKAEQDAERARREAEKAQREAEQAARDVAKAFEEEVQIRLQTLAQVASADFGRFFNLFVAGFDTQAAEVLNRMPEAVQRLAVELTLAEQAERKFNDSIFELNNLSNISVFDTITNKILDFQSSIDAFFAKTETTTRAASQVGGFQKLGQLAAQAYATGLVNAAGAAGDAARRVVDAVKAEFNASVALFDNLANNIADALRSRNQKEEDSILDLLNKEKDAWKDETAAKKDAVDKQLEARIEALDAEKEAVKEQTDDIIKQIEKQADAEIAAIEKGQQARKDAPEPDFSTTGAERAINAQSQAFVDASNARIAALQREKQAIDDLAAAREQDKKIQEAQQKIDTLSRVLQGGVSAGTRRFLVRQIKEQQGAIDDIRAQQSQKAADDAAKQAIDNKIAAEQKYQDQVRATAQAQIDYAQAVAKAQKDFYERQQKALDQADEERKKKIKERQQAEEEAARAFAEAEKKRIEDAEKAEKKAADARKEQLDKDMKDATERIDQNIASIRKFFDEFENAPARIQQQILDLIQGGKTQEIADLFTQAGITPFQLSGLTLGQAFFSGFFNQDQTIDDAVAQNIAAIKEGKSNTEAILSGGQLSTSLVGGAIDALPTQFDLLTNSTLEELGALKDQAVPVSHDHGTEVGISFVDGMINGVTIRTPALEQAVKDAVAKGVAAAQAQIEAHSPSRVTEKQVGLPFSEGIAVGILGGASKIEQAAKQVVNITPSIGQPGSAVVASPASVQAKEMTSAMSGYTSGATQQPVVQEIHEHHWTIQAWDHKDVQRNMGKLLRAFDQGARQNKTGPIGG